MEKLLKNLSNPASTGSLGSNFENRVQSSFVILMLSNGFSPCLPPWQIQKIKLQGKYQGFETDDLIVYVESNVGQKAKLLGQVKRSLSITNSNKSFEDIIIAAWHDYNNKNIFSAETDALALITGPLSAIDTTAARHLLQQAKYAENAKDFINRVELANFTNDRQREKFTVFKNVLKIANNSTELTDNQLWGFMKSFNLLIYDLDIEGVVISLLNTIIGQACTANVDSVRARIMEIVTQRNENAGYITRDSLPEDIKLLFEAKKVESIPEMLLKETDICETYGNISEYGEQLSYMILVGAWDAKSEYDKSIVKNLTGDSYAQWKQALRAILQLSDSPIVIKNNVWKISNQVKMWEILAPRIFDDMLKRFKECVVTILKEHNPQFTLEKGNRFAANIYGAKLNYSPSLRKGVAQSLAFIGCFPEKLTSCSSSEAESFALLCNREIFDDANWILWASLNDLLPIICEASPNSFLDAVEEGLSNEDNPFIGVFEQEDSGVMGGTYLTGLLWALEKLAWDEELLSRVTIILGDLASIDPGGSWANRPINSLIDIYLPWHIQTTASFQKRRVAIKILCNENPNVAFELLLNLLPDIRKSTSGTFKPEYRKPVPKEWNPSITNLDYWNHVSVYADFAIELASGNLDWLKKIVKNLDHLPHSVFNKFLLQLKSESANFTEEDSTSLWTELLTFVKSHEKYSDADWTLDVQKLANIKEVMKFYEPQNPLNYNKYLFAQSDWDLYEERGNWEENEKRLNDKRRAALQTIIDSKGIDGIFEFINMVESPDKIGAVFASFSDEASDSMILPDMILKEGRALEQFINAYIYSKRYHRGWEWVDDLGIENWNEHQQLKFFLNVPPSVEAWKMIDNSFLAIKENYWKKVSINEYSLNHAELVWAIDVLLFYGRPIKTIACFYQFIYKKESFDKELLVNTMLMGITSSESIDNMHAHIITEVIKYLQSDSSINTIDMIRIEWGYFPFLDRNNGNNHKTLETHLASNPVFFHEILCLLYRSKNEPATDKKTDKLKEILAKNAYSLLSNWRFPPGYSDGDSYDGGRFLEWLEEVKRICIESGHLDVAMLHIGEVLFYAPHDSDGFWIDKTVAKTLNDKDSKRLREGFYLKIYNSRGVHFVDPTGDPEKKLSKKYKSLAEETENEGYQRLAHTLRDVAAIYEKEAERIVSRHLENE